MMLLVSFWIFAVALGFRAEVTSGHNPEVCAPPNCSYPCKIDYISKSCPSCECPPVILCSPPKCDPPCRMNYGTTPCPSCDCEDVPPPMVQCSPPKCDHPCSMDYETKPCPSCLCPMVQCALPTPCKPPCKMNYSSFPCSSCECPGKSPIQCPAPKCPSGSSLFYVPSELCPVCK